MTFRHILVYVYCFPSAVIFSPSSLNRNCDLTAALIPVVLPLGAEVSSRDFCCHHVTPEGFFHSAVADRVDVWVLFDPCVPFPKQQNLHDQHSQLDKVNRII